METPATQTTIQPDHFACSGSQSEDSLLQAFKSWWQREEMWADKNSEGVELADSVVKQIHVSSRKIHKL